MFLLPPPQAPQQSQHHPLWRRAQMCRPHQPVKRLLTIAWCALWNDVPLDHFSFLTGVIVTVSIHPAEQSMLVSMSAVRSTWISLVNKGVYLYSYFDSFDKFRDRQLPPQKSLTVRGLKVIYPMQFGNRAKEIWNRQLGQHRDLY